MAERQTVAEKTALDVGSEFARAYADGDFERVRELVARDVLEREINPGGYIELRGPDELIAEARDFTGRYGAPCGCVEGQRTRSAAVVRAPVIRGAAPARSGSRGRSRSAAFEQTIRAALD